MIITTEHDIGEIVFVKTDEEQRERMITEISIKSPNFVLYLLSYGVNNSWHSDVEISKELDLEKKLKHG